MNQEPRYRDEYGSRQTSAARRVLVDLGQVLADYQDCLVVIGGWVPDLLLPEAGEPHVGSIDVDLAIDAVRLADGRYAEMLQLLLNTRRYRMGAKPFQMVVKVDLGDGEAPVQVDVEFLASRQIKLKKNRPPLLAGFRVLQADACDTAFRDPVVVSVDGPMVTGALNQVSLRVTDLSDFVVMKAHALAKRDKPKDAYDLCYILEERRQEVADNWRTRTSEDDVVKAIEFLKEKFASTEAYGPQQVVNFHNASDPLERAITARRAYELVQSCLARIDDSEPEGPTHSTLPSA